MKTIKNLFLAALLFSGFLPPGFAVDKEHSSLTGSSLHVACITGTDSGKSSYTPRVGDLYQSSDTGKLYSCASAGTWVEAGTAISFYADAQNLIVKRNATHPTYQIDIDADALELGGYRLTSVNLTADLTASGANGLDTGAEASSTYYYVWVIYNPASPATASLLSASASSPSMPSGYTQKRLVGKAYNNGSSNLTWCVNTVNEPFDTGNLADLPASQTQKNWFFAEDANEFYRWSDPDGAFVLFPNFGNFKGASGNADMGDLQATFRDGCLVYRIDGTHIGVGKGAIVIDGYTQTISTALSSTYSVPSNGDWIDVYLVADTAGTTPSIELQASSTTPGGTTPSGAHARLIGSIFYDDGTAKITKTINYMSDYIQGWSYVVGDGSIQLTQTINYGVTLDFATMPMVTGFASAANAGAKPTSETSFGNSPSFVFDVHPNSPSTTTFLAVLRAEAGTTFIGGGTPSYYGFRWRISTKYS